MDSWSQGLAGGVNERCSAGAGPLESNKLDRRVEEGRAPDHGECDAERPPPPAAVVPSQHPESITLLALRHRRHSCTGYARRLRAILKDLDRIGRADESEL